MNLRMVDYSKWKLIINQLRMHLQLKVFIYPNVPKLEFVCFHRKNVKYHDFLYLKMKNEAFGLL